MRVTILRARLAIVLCLLTLAACGRSGTPVSPESSSAAPPPLPVAGRLPDWQTLAVAQHNMNAARGAAGYATISVQPQTPVAPGAGPGSVLAAPQAPPATIQPGARHAASFTPADLIKDGGAYDPTLASNLVAPDGADPTLGNFKCNTDPYIPVIQQMAYAVYRFTLTDYATSGQPQSIGTLWVDDNAPSRYFIGLSNWQTGRWDWFDVHDAVVSVATLAPYIRAGDDTLLAAVVVMDTQFRGLVLVQVGADQVRGLGGLGGTAPDAEEALTYYGPDDYYPGKTASWPASFNLDDERLGAVYDQGHTLSCTACASAAMFNYELSTTYGPYWRPADSSSLPTGDVRRENSSKWLYTQTGAGACFIGRDGSWILNHLQNTGGVNLTQVPFNENCTVDYNVATCNAEAAYLRIAGWRSIHSGGQVAIDEIRNQLVNLNHPVMISMTVNDHLTGGGGNGPWNGTLTFHWDGSFPNVFESHSMVITGYSEARQAFRVRNSWGSNWGDGGSFWLGYDVLMGGNFWSSPIIFGCFVMNTNYSAATATHFNITADFAIPPASAACDTSVPSAIHLSWSPVNLATGYRIYRDSTTTLIATIPSGATVSYDDLSVTDSFAHTYFVRTVVGPSVSSGSAQARGWRALPAPPHITRISFVRTGLSQMQFFAYVNNPDPTAAVAYSWGFPAGSILESSPQTVRSPAVTLDQAGTYQGTLTVSNTGGSDQMDFSFTAYNLASVPQANFSVPPVINRNSLALFDGAASTAEQGSKVARYFWDWDGDGFSDFDSTDSQLTHIFTQAGSVSLSLKVVDDRGIESKWVSQSFTVMP